MVDGALPSRVGTYTSWSDAPSCPWRNGHRRVTFDLMRFAPAPGHKRRNPGSVLARIADPRRWFGFAALVVLLGLAWTFRSSVPANATTGGLTPSPRVGFVAPDFTLDLLGGGQVTLFELRGSAVVVNLWASWCPPCRAEMPTLQRVYEANRARGVEILAVNTTFQDTQADAAEFVRAFGLTFSIPLDRTGEVSRSYLLRALPTTFFIDRKGVIRQVVLGGPMSETTVQTAVEELLRED